MRRQLTILTVLLIGVVLSSCKSSTQKVEDLYDVPISSIRCSDPFIFADSSDNTYYMYSTGGGGVINARASKDLENWTQPFPVFEFTPEHWAAENGDSWASEMHLYNGKYYLFTTSHSDEVVESIPDRYDIPHRATQIYVASSPRGPFRDFTGNKAHTPDNWASLDGTFWVEDGVPYMIFCHEWLQTVDGTMELVRLPDDLGVPTEEPVTLFKASDAPWSGEMLELGEKTYGLDLGGNVTDGPFIFKTQTGSLGMLWSSWSKTRYAIGVAYSASGGVKGPWVQEDEPLLADNSGHGMLFRTFDGELKLCLHHVDERDEFPERTPVILDVDDSGDKLVLVPEREPEVIDFSAGKTTPGRKIALKDFDKNFPTDWSGYNYLVMELSCTSGQRVYVGVNTEGGYNEVRNIYYGPNAKIRTAIPLTYLRDLPAGAYDLAATYNHRRPLSYINIEHGIRTELKGVDSLGFRMNMPVKDERIVLYNVYLTVGDPGDKYLSDEPAVDEFGQWRLGEFEGKVHSEKELKAAWAKEDAAIAAHGNTNRSQYGGSLSRRTEATGFFRVEKLDGKWWFVDPDGELFLSIGSNGINPGNNMVYNPLKGIYTNKAPRGYEQPEQPTGYFWPRIGDRPNADMFGHPVPDEVIPFSDWNRYRRFGGDNAYEKACELVVNRLDTWGMNTIGNWSDPNVIALGRKPFMVSLSGLGIEDGILGMPDVYAEDFKERIDEGVRNSVASYLDNKMLIGYFVGNEPTWSNQELRLCELIMKADGDTPLRVALTNWTKKNGKTEESLKSFVYETFGIFLSSVKTALEKYDPNHLNLGIRYGSGVPANEVLELSAKYFDVYSFNNYGLIPNMDNADIIYSATGLPMIIGEFHFGTTDRGLGESLVRVMSQEDRGTAYRAYCETAFAHPAIIGAAWFAWTDQPLFGRNDGENYNIGLVDATDRPYEWMVKAIRDVSQNCYDVHEGLRPAFTQSLQRTGGSFIDGWE